MVARLNIDIAFIFTSSWDASWISTPSESKVAVKIAAAKAARRSYLVTDSSKFGQVGLFNVLPLRELSGIITDTGLPLQAQKMIAVAGVSLIVADQLRNPSLLG
jgi:DeoR/GlpR family transcriptional regulator of sugar metabolism